MYFWIGCRIQIETKKNQAKRSTEECKKLLVKFKLKRIVGNEVKKLSKKFVNKMQECITQQNLDMDITKLTSMQEYIIMTNNQ